MVRCHTNLLPMNPQWQQDYAQRKPLLMNAPEICCANERTPLANSPDWLKAAPMWENLLASWRQSGQKQDHCPSLLNHNAKYKRLLPPYCDFANGVGQFAARVRTLVAGHTMLERIAEAMLQAGEALKVEFGKLHRAMLAIVRGDEVCRRLMTRRVLAPWLLSPSPQAWTLRGGSPGPKGSARTSV